MKIKLKKKRQKSNFALFSQRLSQPVACLADHFFYNPSRQISQRLQQHLSTSSPCCLLSFELAFHLHFGLVLVSFRFDSLRFDCFVAFGGEKNLHNFARQLIIWHQRCAARLSSWSSALLTSPLHTTRKSFCCGLYANLCCILNQFRTPSIATLNGRLTLQFWLRHQCGTLSVFLRSHLYKCVNWFASQICH